jgi:hypothetical protein
MNEKMAQKKSSMVQSYSLLGASQVTPKDYLPNIGQILLVTPQQTIRDQVHSHCSRLLELN